MFTHNSIKWIVVFTLLTVTALTIVPDTTLASDPDTVTADANAHTTLLDSLRDRGQAVARAAQARHARDLAVFDHTSYLDSLHARANRVRHQPAIVTANDYVTHLAQLQSFNSGAYSDSGAHISLLDRLRQEGQTATTNKAQVAAR